MFLIKESGLLLRLWQPIFEGSQHSNTNQKKRISYIPRPKWSRKRNGAGRYLDEAASPRKDLANAGKRRRIVILD